MMNQNLEKNIIPRLLICRKTVSCSLTGALIGFLSAAVIYSNLPAWVPKIFSRHPVLFFSIFIIICIFLGYIWAITDLLGYSDTIKRVPMMNAVLSGAFTGFLVTAVFYSKYCPSWFPFIFSIYPAVVFTASTLIGAAIGFFWHRSATPN
jgi:hypothetical protein